MIKEFTDTNSLTVTNKLYSDYLRAFVELWLMSDLGKSERDATIEVVSCPKTAEVEIVCKSDGIIAGIEEIEWLCGSQKLDCRWQIADGDKVKKGQVIARIKGDYKVLMRYERILLNILQRMSGIATCTASLSAKVRKYGVKLACTRKTYWGMLDKKACAVGGGLTHRLGLWDAVMIKDNHFGMGFDLKRVKNVKFVEIEVENLRQLDKAMAKLKSVKLPKVVMLDNFNIKKIPEAIKKLRAEGITVEISGGINEKNLVEYAKFSPDVISMGSLTQNARAMDIGMEIVSKTQGTGSRK